MTGFPSGRAYYARHLRVVEQGQYWRYEVEIFMPQGRYTVPDEIADALTEWCRVNCSDAWSRGSNRLYWFKSENDAMLFQMAFSR